MSFRRSLTFLFANCAVFAGGMAWAFRQAQPALGTPVVSYLLSRSKNPSGHPLAAASLSVSALFLFAAVSSLERSTVARRLVRLGCFGLLFMAVLSCFMDSLGPLHDSLAALTLAALLLGVAFGAESLHRTATPSGRIIIRSSHVALVFLVALMTYSEIDASYFDNSAWWRNLAEAEWALIAVIDAALAAIMITAERRSQILTRSSPTHAESSL